jgi:hypothetical protein
MATIVVSGALANKPANGGAAWTRLSWALGFKRLGYDVFFLEQIAPTTCVDASGSRCPIEQSVNLAFFEEVTKHFELDAALVVEGEHRSFGTASDVLPDIAQSADMLVNISGHLTHAALKPRFRRRVFIDLDPGYTQLWHAAGLAEERLRDHDFYFSVGENIGQPFCEVPSGGVHWRRVRQPVVLDDWPVTPCAQAPLRFTTIASWRGPLGRVAHGSTTYGVKAHEFRKFMTLPTLSPPSFEVALDVDPADSSDVDKLRANGWHVVDPKCAVPDPASFRRYVQHSGAEFSVAQGIYVETQSGWFSDRTVRYLASGKPAVVQETGWSRNYPSGQGLLSFTTVAEAVEATSQIASDYATHSRAARVIAEEFFDSDKVLTKLLKTVGACAPRQRPFTPCASS